MITIKNDKEIAALRKGGKILGRIMKGLLDEIRPGTTTSQLERLAAFLIKTAGGAPSFKGYKSNKNDKPFPTVLCACVNNEVVHAPSLPPRELKSGDIISLDIGMKYQGLYTDMAGTGDLRKKKNQSQKT